MKNQPFDSFQPFLGGNSEDIECSDLIADGGDDDGNRLRYAPQRSSFPSAIGIGEPGCGRNPQPHFWNNNCSDQYPIPGNIQQGYPSSTLALDSTTSPLGLEPQHGFIQNQYGYSIPTAVLDDAPLDPGYGEMQPGFSQDQYWYPPLTAVPDFSRMDLVLGEPLPEFNHNHHEHPLSTVVPDMDPLDLGYRWPQPGLDYNQTESFGTMPNNDFSMSSAFAANMPEMFRMNETQPNPALHPTTALVPLSGVNPTVNNNNSISCRWCAAIFGRNGERNRHEKKHLAHKYRCMFSDCDKTFYRPDKLRDHLRQGHKHANPHGNQYVGNSR
ncbi:hypothetical protein J3E71DRAFT_341165 [Bipolaris maydis]|nr:hypothetical protein J3E71DRAFT_341165 [Bipolaris maydis]